MMTVKAYMYFCRNDRANFDSCTSLSTPLSI